MLHHLGSAPMRAKGGRRPAAMSHPRRTQSPAGTKKLNGFEAEGPKSGRGRVALYFPVAVSWKFWRRSLLMCIRAASYTEHARRKDENVWMWKTHPPVWRNH